MKKVLKISLCLILIMSFVVSFAACGKSKNETVSKEPFDGDYYNIIGSGRQSVYFYFIDPFGNRQNFSIATDAVKLVDAFRENNMVTSPVGEKIKVFAGVHADESNGYEWVLYADGKEVKGKYEDVKINVKVTYALIAERTDLR